MFVPVVDNNNKPLMPTTLRRAKRWVKSRKATYFWSRGVFCVRLNQEPSARNFQVVAEGIDTGSKKEGYSVCSKAHTYINIQADAITHVSKNAKTRREKRRSRRSRKTPCRARRNNRACLKQEGRMPSSTKARWEWKVNNTKWLMKLFPITVFVVEDIKAQTKKGKKGWNKSFSPLEVGKKWFYSELEKLGQLELRQGWETAELRKVSGLPKNKNKMQEDFFTHCVDAFVLACDYVQGNLARPDNISIYCLKQLQFHRRKLHKEFNKKGVRTRYGGTMSLGFKRGSLVKCKEFGLVIVGGFSSTGKISVHDRFTKTRLSQDVDVADVKFLCYNTTMLRYLPKGK